MKRIIAFTLFSLMIWMGQASSIKEGKILPPTVVAIPPSDAYIGLSRMPDGEIRHYNYGEQAEAGSFYISSVDSGRTWKRVNLPKEIPFADVCSPLSGEYVRMIGVAGMGTYVVRTQGGLYGGRNIIKVSDTLCIMCKPPVFIKQGRRVVIAAHYGLQKGLPRACFSYYSDDDGLSWHKSALVTTPDHKGGGLHQGIRWNHGAAEPSIVELKDGRLWMLIRTSQDKYYQSFSSDGGENWEQSTPSPFYGTITMPTVGRLSDGRLLFMGSMSTPLPEVGNTDGVWEDVFTNRTVVHAAISADEGKTWQGFRELYLDDRRDAADFGSVSGIDKGLHQTQFVEAYPGRIIVSVGQHRLHRKILALDEAWLLQKNRRCDFSDSLKQWSVFSYCKGIVGHCGYNRKPGCVLTKEGLEVKRLNDPDLLSAQAGAVWNFPALRKGYLALKLCLKENIGSGKLLLNDRWFNPSDSTAALFAPYVLKIDRKTLGIKDDRFHRLVLTWDLDKKHSGKIVSVDGKRRFRLPLLADCPHGLFYLHLLSSTVKGDQGYIVSEVETGPSI